MQESSADIEELRAENARLRARMAYLLEQTERNHDIMCRHQAFDLQIVGASGFPELVQTIIGTLPVVSDLDAVTLTLVDPQADIHTVMLRLGVDFEQFPHLLFSEQAVELGYDSEAPRPIMGPYSAKHHAEIFPATRVELRSVARVPLLRHTRLIGSLNLGSCDPARFTPALGTDFVEHMGSIIAICLENVISNEMLKYIGLTDALTGVYNRRYMDRRLLEEIARARRQSYRLSCMYIDIDHFKRVNDTVGHQAGDEVLREVSGRIKRELRVSDALGRYGGEEFVVLLVDTELDSARQVAERIRTSIAQHPVTIGSGDLLDVTVSIGVAALSAPGPNAPAEPDIGDLALQLVAAADAALYQAKAGGRNRVVSLA